MCEVVNAIFFVLRGGCPWRMVPEHFPPHQTTYAWFARFRDDGTWRTVNHPLTAERQRRFRNGWIVPPGVIGASNAVSVASSSTSAAVEF
jgi:transposase